MIPSQSRLCGPLLRSIVSQGTCSAACGGWLVAFGCRGSSCAGVHDLWHGPGAPLSPYQPRDRRGQGPHSTATVLPAPGPAIASSAAGIVFAVCSCTVAMLSWRRGDGFTGPVGVRGTRFHWEGLKTKSEKCRKQKGAWAITGLGHGLINWCCEWRCPLYPEKRTILRAGDKVR